MIENLDGIFEKVNYKQSTTIKLYNNDEHEDYPLHWHPALEIVMPTAGKYRMRFPNNEVELNEGDVCIVCPGCLHGTVAPEDGRRIIFQSNTSLLRFTSEIELLISFMSPYCIITPEQYPTIHATIKVHMNEIRDIYNAGETFAEVSIYSKLLEMLVLVGRNYSINRSNAAMNNYPSGREEYATKFVEICDYINAHCSEDLKLVDVADMSGFSKFYFERLFKQFTGTSFYKYVNQKRIVKAQELLMEPGNSVTDVALNCGFTSISSFIRMFKLQKGCTPTEFKSMYYLLRDRTPDCAEKQNANIK